jgi:hypothetical protein
MSAEQVLAKRKKINGKINQNIDTHEEKQRIP